MTKYFVKPNEDFPDDAHRFWLQKNQFTIGELFVDENSARWIAAQLNRAADTLELCGCEEYYPAPENGKCSRCDKNAYH